MAKDLQYTSKKVIALINKIDAKMITALENSHILAAGDYYKDSKDKQYKAKADLPQQINDLNKLIQQLSQENLQDFENEIIHSYKEEMREIKARIA